MPDTIRRRLFFALWPQADVASSLEALGQQVHAEAGGRRMRRDTLHLTLAFIGGVPQRDLPRLRSIAADISADSFEFDLDRLGFWNRKGIVWAGCSGQPAGLDELAARLGTGLRAAGFEVEARPFVAHVTLLRNARHETALPEPGLIRWKAADFVLVESLPSPERARYRVVGRWPLLR
ncbi:MAG: RNA 2',3'-cyclic phosphodiesterase [Zoogloea sp.]|nr:RNA 2',3'-cyclic phosphodiesterase [Zoogloea sp.]